MRSTAVKLQSDRPVRKHLPTIPKKMKRYLLVFLTLVSLLANGQYKAEEFEAALLEANYGALLVYNGQTNSFSVKFVAASVRPTEQANFVLVDNTLIQSSILPFTEDIDFIHLDAEGKKKYLTYWKAYEKKWVEEQMNLTLTEKEEFLDIAGKPFLYWSYDMPKSKKKGSVTKQVYLVTICFDQIFLLSGPVVKDSKEETMRAKVLSIAETLTLFPNQVQDLQKLYDELKKP